MAMALQRQSLGSRTSCASEIGDPIGLKFIQQRLEGRGQARRLWRGQNERSRRCQGWLPRASRGPGGAAITNDCPALRSTESTLAADVPPSSVCEAAYEDAGT